MSRNGPGNDSESVRARIPGPLWERIQSLFRTQRGYDPSTPQEALGVLCDLAAGELSAEGDPSEQSESHGFATAESESDLAAAVSTEQAVSSRSMSLPPASPEQPKTDSGSPDTTEPAAALSTAPQSIVDVVDRVFPDGWDKDGFCRRYLPAVVDAYSKAVKDGDDTPEQTALETVADRSDIDSSHLRKRLVSNVYHDEPLPDQIAAEFFSEALEVAESRVRAEREEQTKDAERVELAEHGGLSSTTTFEGTPMEPPNELTPKDEVSFDDLVDDLDATSDPMVPAGSTVEPLLDTSNADSRVREVAGEILDEMTGDMFEQLENGVDQGTGTGVADGQGMIAETAEDSLSGDSAADTDAPTEDTPESIPGPLRADPETECDACGASYQVSELETALDENGTAVLLCPDCYE